MKALLAVMLGVPRLAGCGADAQEAVQAPVAPAQVRAACGPEGLVLPLALPAGAATPVAPVAAVVPAAPGQP